MDELWIIKIIAMSLVICTIASYYITEILDGWFDIFDEKKVTSDDDSFTENDKIKKDKDNKN